VYSNQIRTYKPLSSFGQQRNCCITLKSEPTHALPIFASPTIMPHPLTSS